MQSQRGLCHPPTASASPGPKMAISTLLGSGCHPSAISAPMAHTRRTSNINGGKLTATKSSRERRRCFAGSGGGSLLALPSAEN